MNKCVIQSNVNCFPLSLKLSNDVNWVGDEIVYATRSYSPVDFFKIDTKISEDKTSIKILNTENFSFFKIESSTLINENNVSVIFYPHHDFPTVVSTAKFKNAIEKKSIVFVGLARDCESTVKLNIDLLIKLGKHFKEFKVLVFENDSKDNTSKVLSELKIDNVETICLPSLDAEYPQRTERLAYVRNLGLDKALKTNFDYYCPVDLDGVLTTNGYEFDINGFLSNFYYEEFWDAVFPVSAGFYYDLWALRHCQLSPDDWMIAESRGTSALGIDIIRSRETFTRQYDLRKMNGWLKVDSAFGGIGIYKIDQIQNSRYTGKENKNIISEHVPFNLSLSSINKRLYLNPKFVTYGYGEVEYRIKLLRDTLSI